MKIKVYLNDWFFNMGIIGFVNIVKKVEENQKIIIEDNCLEFDSGFLKEFHHYYFDYFLDEYNVCKRVKKSIENILSYTKNNPDKLKDNITKIKDIIKDKSDKVKKFDEIAYGELNNNLEEITKIKEIEMIDELEKRIEECINILSRKHINEKLTLNLYKFIVGDNYFGQVSFFNVNKAKLDLNGLKEIMYRDYLQSIIEYGTLNDILADNDISTVKNYIEDKLQDKNLPKNILSIYKAINKKFIKNGGNIEEIKEYLKSDSLKGCHMCGENNGLIGDYTESNFAPLAVSSANARNMFWNFNTEYPICDVCKLVLFCTPAGSVYMRKNYIKDSDNEFYGFVNMDTCIEELYSCNHILRQNSNKDNPFNEFIVDMISENVRKSKWQLENVLFVEFKASIGKKKCIMNYFNMPMYMLNFFTNEEKNKTISSIKNGRLKAAIVDAIFKNEDLLKLINDGLRDKVKDIMEGKNKVIVREYDYYLAVKARYFLNQYKGGKNSMDDKKLRVVYYSGRDIHDYFKKNNSENKINSIAYRLLNTSKVRNKKDFMDIILRTFMASEMSVPQLFLDVMAEKELDFESIAHAFVSGLISEKYESNKEGEV